MFGVAIVDDEYFVREMLKNSLDWNSHGFEIIGEASNAQQAIELIREKNPELVLLDIDMPGKDGFVVASAIRDLGSQAKIIILTGYNVFEFAKKAIQFRVYDYLLKPVLEAELSQILGAVGKEIEKENQAEKTIKNLSDNVNILLRHIGVEALNNLDDKDVNEEEKKELRGPQEMVERVKQYVQQHLSDEDLNVQTVSENLFVNMSYMSSTFKKVCGQGLHDYIFTARMEKAYQIILTTDADTQEVASATGFKNPVYFGRCLKKHFGRSFLEIRRIQRKYKESN